MAFDFGLKRIGVAVGQEITSTASPVTILKAKDGIPDWTEIEKLLNTYKPVILVVGLPLNMDNSQSELAHLATKFSRKLSGRFQLTVELMDERLSSFEARQQSPGPGRHIDHLAACLILESWFRESHS